MNAPVHHQVVQKSEEWLAVRSRHFNGSEAKSVLGRWPATTRGELLRMKALGQEKEIWERLSEDGAKAEEASRPVAEKILGEELFPGTLSRDVDGLPLLSSLDGMTLSGDTIWECKLWNQEMPQQVKAGVVPACHRPQLEQGLLVTGAKRAMFMMSDTTADNVVWCWYESIPEERDALLDGWKQFAIDLANYEHVEAPDPVVAAKPDSLPALLIDIEGAVKGTNLQTYQTAVLARIEAINTDLQTDQDFADAEAMVKFLGEAEKEVKGALDRAIAQTSSIEELFRVARDLQEAMRQKRLALNSLVTKRKESIRSEIIDDARRAVQQHCIELAEGIDGRLVAPGVPVNFRDAVAAALKSKRTIQSLRDSAAQVVADTKIELNGVVNRQTANLKWLDEQKAPEHLFTDLAGLSMKQPDDFRAAVAARVAQHEAALAAERERVRAAEEERARRIAAEEARAAQAAESELLKREERVQIEHEERARIREEADRRAAERETAANAVWDRHMKEDDEPVRMAPYSAVANGAGVLVALEDGIPSMVTLEDATHLRDELTAAIRSAKKAVK